MSTLPLPMVHRLRDIRMKQLQEEQEAMKSQQNQWANKQAQQRSKDIYSQDINKAPSLPNQPAFDPNANPGGMDELADELS